jgi:glycosyltransferase involved in cell wall biosynthesis
MSQPSLTAGPHRVACLIPVYNHASRVAAVVESALALGAPVYVVDDGSTDGTADVLADLPGATVLRHPENRGKGAALMTGFAAALDRADWVVTLDADGQHDPAEATRLVQALPPPPGPRPIVVGCREGMDDPDTPWTSRFGRKFSNFWVRAGGGGKLSDTQSGFRLYPVPETLQLRPRARRFQFEVEILVLAGWSRLPVREVTVRVVYQERISHFRPWTDFWRNSSTFSRLIFQRIVLPRFLRARRIPGRAAPEQDSDDGDGRGRGGNRDPDGNHRGDRDPDDRDSDGNHRDDRDPDDRDRSDRGAGGAER